MLRTLSVVAMSILLMPVICLYRKLPRSICILRSLSNSAHSTNAPAMSSIESIVAAFLHNDCRIAANSYVLLSVSGGLDSMAMLHILTSISRKYLPLDLEVISFNHKLREESDEEVSEQEKVQHL